MSEFLSCVEIEPTTPARRAVIWLHGLGANGHDFEPVIPHLEMPAELGVRFVFPNAPSMPVTLNGGMVMPAWYDIGYADLEFQHDEAGVRASAAQLRALVERERERGIEPAHIVLAGFSQGGAVALFEGLRHPDALAGILALSTYLVCPDALAQEASEANRAVAIFQAHGTLDPMVQHDRGTASRDRLVEMGHTVEWHEYPMQHEVCLEEIQAIGEWLRRVLH